MSTPNPKAHYEPVPYQTRETTAHIVMLDMLQRAAALAVLVTAEVSAPADADSDYEVTVNFATESDRAITRLPADVYKIVVRQAVRGKLVPGPVSQSEAEAAINYISRLLNRRLPSDTSVVHTTLNHPTASNDDYGVNVAFRRLVDLQAAHLDDQDDQYGRVKVTQTIAGKPVVKLEKAREVRRIILDHIAAVLPGVEWGFSEVNQPDVLGNYSLTINFKRYSDFQAAGIPEYFRGVRITLTINTRHAFSAVREANFQPQTPPVQA